MEESKPLLTSVIFAMKLGLRGSEFCVPYNPQQNGVAERKNRTIVEPAKAMIHDQNLQTSFWDEASRTVVYVQNRCPHRILENKTPEEAFTGVKPNVSHLRIFGCPVYIHIPKDKRTSWSLLARRVVQGTYHSMQILVCS